MCSQKVFFDKGTFDARVLCVSMCQGLRSSLKLSAFRIRHLREHSSYSLPFLQPISLSPYGSMHPLGVLLSIKLSYSWQSISYDALCSMIMATIIKSFEKYFMLKYENGIQIVIKFPPAKNETKIGQHRRFFWTSPFASKLIILLSGQKCPKMSGWLRQSKTYSCGTHTRMNTSMYSKIIGPTALQWKATIIEPVGMHFPHING